MTDYFSYFTANENWRFWRGRKRTLATEIEAAAALDPESMSVQLVAPSLWQPLTASVLATVTPTERPLTQAILSTFHNRHVGIPPVLAASLATVLRDPSQQRNAPRPWDAVIARIQRELMPAQEEAQFYARRRQSSFGALLSANPTNSALRIMMPVLLEACRRIKRCYLFCADELPESITNNDYTQYAMNLSTEIQQLANRDDEELQLFWQERAIVLSSLSRETKRAGAATSALPEMEPTALRLLQQITPELSSERQAKKLLRLVTPLKRQRSQTRKEGGVDGIRVTRRMDDLNSILMSEFMHHRLLLLDRILNTGYLAIERPPERVKLRDVLIAAMMPVDVQPHLHVDFLKACWFDCMMQLSVLLRHHKLHRSEFRWIEGDTLDQARSTVFSLEQMPMFESDIEEVATAGYRDEFLRALRWLPAYLDARGTFQPVRHQRSDPFPALNTQRAGQAPQVTEAPERAMQLKQWLRDAWSTQRESRVWHHQTDEEAHEHRRRKDQLAVGEFAYVHIMLFLPAQLRGSTFHEFSARTGQLARVLDIAGSPNQHASIIWMPASLLPKKDHTSVGLTPAETWDFEIKGEASKALLSNAGDELTGTEIARALEQAWLDQLLKEMWRG